MRSLEARVGRGERAYTICWEGMGAAGDGGRYPLPATVEYGTVESAEGLVAPKGRNKPESLGRVTRVSSRVITARTDFPSQINATHSCLRPVSPCSSGERL